MLQDKNIHPFRMAQRLGKLGAVNAAAGIAMSDQHCAARWFSWRAPFPTDVLARGIFPALQSSRCPDLYYVGGRAGGGIINHAALKRRAANNRDQIETEQDVQHHANSTPDFALRRHFNSFNKNV